MTVKLLRLYRSEKGIWRYDLERDGKLFWASLHTRDEREARETYAKIKVNYEKYGGSFLAQVRAK